MLSPVILFVYNRPEHTRTTMEALAGNPLAKESSLFIFADGPKISDKSGRVERVHEYISSEEVRSYFDKVEIFESPQNIGLANSVIRGVTKVFSLYDRVIVVEDDAVPARDFLKFMNMALDYYSDDSFVWTVGGFSYDLVMPDAYSYSVYPLGRTSSYAWGCWKDRWDSIDWELKDYRKFRFNPRQRYLFNRFGNDRSTMLDAQMKGYIDSWAIRFCYTMFKRNMSSVIPVKTKIQNIGLDGSGTHHGRTSGCAGLESAHFDDAEGEFRFHHFSDYDERIRTQFITHFDLPRLSLMCLYFKFLLSKTKPRPART